MTRAYADGRLRAILRLPALFDPDVAELRECAAVLGVVLTIRRIDWSDQCEAKTTEYQIGRGAPGGGES